LKCYPDTETSILSKIIGIKTGKRKADFIFNIKNGKPGIESTIASLIRISVFDRLHGNYFGISNNNDIKIPFTLDSSRNIRINLKDENDTFISGLLGL